MYKVHFMSIKFNLSSIKKKLKKDLQAEMPAFLGNLTGTVLADNNGNVYVTLFNGEVLTVYNGAVPNVARLPIVIGYGGTEKLRVLRSRDVYPTPPYPDVPGHADLHAFPGPDTIPVRGEQFLPGLVVPVSGMTVKVYGFAYQLSDGWHVLPTQTVDLTSSVPTDGALFALLEVDNTGVIQITLGSSVDSRSALEYGDIPDTTSDCMGLAAVKLYAGQSRVLQTLANDNDIIDLRFGRASSGAGGGGGVESVSGDGVDNTDPLNPVISYAPTSDYIEDTITNGVTNKAPSENAVYDALAGKETAGAAATAEANAKSYADGLVVGLWDDRGSFDASVNAYPSSGGSGTAGAIKKGDVWTVSVAGTLPTSQVVEVGDVVRALVDTPGNTQANWAITQNNIGYTAENSANKATTMSGNTTSNIVYLSAKAVYDWAIGLFSQLGHTHDASVITYTPTTTADWDGSTDPGDVDNALDQLAERVTDIEAGGTGREILVANRTYYIRTDGSDSNNGLSNTSGGAWLTIAHANSVIATLDKNGYNVEVYMGAGTWTEEFIPKLGIGDGTVKWYGTLSLDNTASSATVAAGSGGTAGTVTKTGQYTGKTLKGYLAYFVTDAAYRVIYSNTNNVLTLADLAPSSTTQDVSVYSWGTIINRITAPVGVGNLEIYGIHFQGDGTYSVYQNAFSAVMFSYCQFNDQQFFYSSNNPFIYDSYFYTTNAIAMVTPGFTATGIWQRCYFRAANNTASGFVANRGAQVLIYGGTMDGDAGGGNKATYGFRSFGNATIQFSSGTNIGNVKVYNCDVGIRVDQAGVVVGSSSGVTNSGNGSNTSNDGTGVLG